MLGQKVTAKVAAAYTASLAPLTKAQLVQAFSRALDEAGYMPVPALLRSFASIGDPITAEAREELFRIVTAMRGKHARSCATFLGLRCTEPRRSQASGSSIPPRNSGHG
jgi:hypothetical protein